MRSPRETKLSVQRNVGRRVAEVRVAAGLTQAEFAAKLGTSERYVQRVEAGGANLTIESLVELARRLGVSTAELFLPASSPARAEPGRPRGRRDSSTAPRRHRPR